MGNVLYVSHLSSIAIRTYEVSGSLDRMMFFNRSGEIRCRLTRSQHILEARKVSKTWWFYPVSLFLFRVPELLEQRLASMWHDDMIHQKDWKPFITAILRDWGKSRKMVRLLHVILSKPIPDLMGFSASEFWRNYYFKNYH